MFTRSLLRLFCPPYGAGCVVAAGVLAAVLLPAPAVAQGVCYLVADSGGSGGGDDLLTRVVRTTGAETVIGTGTATSAIEAAAYWPGTHTIYGANGGQLGVVSFTGTFSPHPSAIGTGTGAAGSIAFTDVDGLAFDPFTGTLYGTHRREGGTNPDDILFQIDVATGQHVDDAFGAGVDYVVVPSTAAVGFADIDDIAIDPNDGQMYGIANNGGSGDRLVRIDKTTGAVTDVGPLGQDDMEGMDFDPNGIFYGTTGSLGGAHSNSFFTVDKATGAATLIAALPGGTDYESIACLTDGVNTISGRVFFDGDASSTFEDATDTGTAGVTIQLYRDTDGNGQADAGEPLLTTGTTDGDGLFSFTLAATGNFVVQPDGATMPAGILLTTAEVHAASFTGYGNTDAGNDVGWTREVDLSLTKTVDQPSPNQGGDVTFTLTLANAGPGDATGVTVADLLPAGLTFASATASQGTYDSGAGLWTAGALAAGASATLQLAATVDTADPVTNTAEVATTDQPDADSTPGNGSGTEDDEDDASVTPQGSSGGGDGGLESNGTMASTLARVLFDRQRQAAQTPDEEATPLLFADARAAGKNGLLASEELLTLIPEHGPEDSRAHVVSPDDLLPVTNATSLFAADYLRTDGRRLAALFATTTPAGEIYEHTKIVCDRLRGATLEAVEVVEVGGARFIITRLRHPDGTLDHAVSFVAYPTGGGFTVDSRFLLREYAPPAYGPEVLNFQVWSVSRAYTIGMVERILAAMQSRGRLSFRSEHVQVPQVYVRGGTYAQGRLTLDLYNAAGAQTLYLTGGTLARAESGTRSTFEMQVPLPAPVAGAPPVSRVEIPVGPLFDVAFFVQTDRSEGADLLYLADGAWSYAHDEADARVEAFTVEPSVDATAAPGAWRVDRNARLAGDVRSWAVLFRYLRSNGRPVDLSAYGYLEFTAWGRGQVRLLVEKASAAADHYHTTFRLQPEPRRYRIWFDELRRSDGRGGFTPEDLVGLAFYVVGDQRTEQPFDLHVEAVRFGGGEGDPLATVPDVHELAPNYPNPFNPETTITFGLAEEQDVRLVVYDVLGRTIAVLAEGRRPAGRYTVRFDATGLSSGVYLYRLHTETGMLTRTMMLLK